MTKTIANYRLWVNAERTVLVRLWQSGVVGQPGVVEVCRRESPDHVWGPPVTLHEETEQ